MEYKQLANEVKMFAEEKGFTAYHNPKDVAIALSVEAAELLEHFMWINDCQFSSEKKQEIGYEMADVMIYLMHMSESLNINLMQVTKEKLEINKKRF